MITKARSKTTVEQIELHLPKFSTDFDVTDILGEGGFGQVVKARNTIDLHYYAVKIIPVNHFARTSIVEASREVKALARLEHTNIVRYHSTWIESSAMFYSSKSSDLADCEAFGSSYSGGSPSDSEGLDLSRAHRLKFYIQMELCKASLEDYLTQRNKLIFEKEPANETTIELNRLVSTDSTSHTYCINLKENMRIFKGIVKGLHRIHEEGFIHRDLKPSNILFSCDNFTPKIGDFGLVSDVRLHLGKNKSASRQHLNMMSEVEYELTAGVGTATYVSPEQLNSAAYDEKSDIFSLGIIFFELFCPFQTEMERSSALKNLRETKTLPSDFAKKWPREVLMLSHTLFTTLG